MERRVRGFFFQLLVIIIIICFMISMRSSGRVSLSHDAALFLHSFLLFPTLDSHFGMSE